MEEGARSEEVMKRKTLFGKDYTDKEYIKVFFYLLIGGSAAVLEWILFYFLYRAYGVLLQDVGPTEPILAATATAFSISTVYHYVLGNIFVFESGRRYGRRAEISLVFLVSGMGLLWNLLLMWLFTSQQVLALAPVPAKMLASAVVTVWNYLSRKKWIF